MAYDPADLRIPGWLLRLLDTLVKLHIPIGFGWRFGLTRPGILMISALIGIWAAALYSSNNLLYLCGGMLSALVLVSIAQSIALLKSIPPLAATLPDWIEINIPHALYHRVTLAKLPLGIPAFAAAVDVHWPELESRLELRTTAGHNSMQLRGRLMGHQRCSLALSQQFLSTSAPLGLWSIQRRRNDPATLNILPKPVTWHGGAQGSSHLTRRIEGDEYSDLRSYARGDSP